MEDKRRNGIDETIAYYDQNATVFVESTVNADITKLYRSFEEFLNPGARILDLGCGSGRDSKYFVRHGYDVVAVDPSQAMCEQTRSYACVPVYKLKAEEMQFSDEFDAVWACASLLHISRDNQIPVFRRIMNALKNDGIIYCSWKYGDKNRLMDNRQFTDMNEALLQKLIYDIRELDVLRIWITRDVRKEKSKEKWLNALLRKRI